MKLIKKIAIGIALVITILLATLAIYPQLYIFAYVKITCSIVKTPDLYIVPVYREIASKSDDNKNRLKYQGLEVSNLWGNVKEVKETSHTSAITFDNDMKLIIINNNKTKVIDLLKQDVNANPFAENVSEINNNDTTNALIDFYGNDILSCDFNYFNTIWSATPNDFLLTMSKKELVAKLILLNMKEISRPFSHKKQIYHFQTNNFKGFQFGDAIDADVIYLQFYDEENNEYMIIIRGPSIKQDDIDIILSNLVEI